MNRWIIPPGPLDRWDVLQSAILSVLAAAFIWPALMGHGVLLALDLAGLSLPWAALPGAETTHNPLLSDTLSQYYPWRYFFRETVRSGHWPLWNPYILAGHPTFASINEQIFYPLNILSVFLPAERSFGWFAWIHLSLAAIGLRSFAKLHFHDNPSAFLAAAAFMFSGPVVVWLEYPAFLSTMAWAGWTFYFLERLLREGRPRDAACTGLALGLSLLGGQTQYSLYLAALTASYAMGRLVWIARNRPRLLIPATKLTTLSAVIGGAIGAIAYAPALELVARSHRIPMDLDQLLTYALPLANAATFLLPDALGSPVRGDFVGFLNFNETAVYVGLCVVALVLLLPVLLLDRGALSLPRGLCGPLPFEESSELPRTEGELTEANGQPGWRCGVAVSPEPFTRIAVLIFGGAALLTLLLLFGWKPAVAVVWLVPPMRYFGLNRLAILLPLTLGFVAAFSYLRLPARGDLRWRRTRYAVLVGILLIGGVIAAGLGQLSRPGPATYARHDLLLGLAIAGLSIVAVVGRVWSDRPGLPGIVLRWLGPLVLTVDLFAWGYGYNTILPENPMDGPPPSPLTVLPRGLLAARSVGIPVDEMIFGPNLGMLWDTPTPDGYVSEYVRAYGDFVHHANPVADELGETRYRSLHPGGNNVNFSQARAAYLDLLGVRYVVTSANTEIPDIYRAEHDLETPPIAGSTTIGAVFRARQNGLNRIDVFPVTHGRTVPGWLALHLKSDPAESEHVAYVRVEGHTIKDGVPLTFWFKPIANSAGRQFYFYLDAPETRPSDAISLWSSTRAQTGDGHLVVNGQNQPGALTFASYAVPFDGWPKLAEANRTVVFENVHALPRIFVVQRARVLTDDQFYAALDDGTLDPHREAGVAEPPPSDFAAILAGPPDTALAPEASTNGPQEIVVRATLPRPGLLVITNVWYPGWRAQVDGVERPVQRVDAVFQGVYLPSGTHVIRLAFDPASLHLGLALDSVGIMLVGLAFAWDRQVRKQDGP